MLGQETTTADQKESRGDASMKAVLYKEYGGPEVLRCLEVARPVIAEDEVLVKVYGSSVNFGDVALVKGSPFVVRFSSGLRTPKYPILGGDVAGKIEAVGRYVKRFQPGDEVFADNGRHGFGAFAEYVAVPEKALALKPANTSFADAAAAPQAAVVALQGLRDNGRIEPGHKVLINGASGGIGPFAVQIAKAFDAEVTGVCSGRNIDFVRSIGADHAIDYTRVDFTKSAGKYDLIFDIVANHSVSDYARVLTPDGIYVACAFNSTSLVLGPFLSMTGGRTFSSLVHKPNANDLEVLKDLFERGKVISVVDRCYPLHDIAEAIRYVDEGNPRGKVVITVNSQSGG